MDDSEITDRAFSIGPADAVGVEGSVVEPESWTKRISGWTREDSVGTAFASIPARPSTPGDGAMGAGDAAREVVGDTTTARAAARLGRGGGGGAADEAITATSDVGGKGEGVGSGISVTATSCAMAGLGVSSPSEFAATGSRAREVGRDTGNSVERARLWIKSCSSATGELRPDPGGVLKPSLSEAGVNRPDSSRVPLRIVATSSRGGVSTRSAGSSTVGLPSDTGRLRGGSGGAGASVSVEVLDEMSVDIGGTRLGGTAGTCWVSVLTLEVGEGGSGTGLADLLDVPRAPNPDAHKFPTRLVTPRRVGAGEVSAVVGVAGAVGVVDLPMRDP